MCTSAFFFFFKFSFCVYLHYKLLSHLFLNLLSFSFYILLLYLSISHIISLPLLSVFSFVFNFVSTFFYVTSTICFIREGMLTFMLLFCSFTSVAVSFHTTVSSLSRRYPFIFSLHALLEDFVSVFLYSIVSSSPLCSFATLYFIFCQY